MTDDVRIAIASRLREARALAGLSQGQVAKLLGYHRPTISEIEAGNRKVSADELTKFCDIYDVAVDWVVGTSSHSDEPKLELAARELAKLDPDDLEKLLSLISAMKDSK